MKRIESVEEYVDIDAPLTFDENLQNAVIQLLKREPYYGWMMLEVNYLEITDPKERAKYTTACIDGRGRLRINTEFFAELTPTQRVGILKHELLHLIYRHPAEMARIQNKERWNIACDLAINSYLTEVPHSGKWRGVFAEDFKLPPGLTAYEYYDKMPKDDETIRLIVSQSGGSIPTHVWDLGEEMSEEIAQRLEHILDREQSRMRGNLPGNLSKILDRLRRLNQINWKDQLRRLVKKTLVGDWGLRWKRPDRRYGLIPSRQREKKHRLVIAIDTSGSTMDVREIFFGEIESIRAQCAVEITVLECDAAVGKEYKLKKGAEMPKECSGGGGTAFQPVFDYVKDKKIQDFGCLIFLTDGYGDTPVDPGYPVIWVETQDKKACDWGHHIKVRVGDHS